MRNFYVACELGADCGRVMLGTLYRNELSLSEVRRFPNVPNRDRNTLQWDMAHLFQEILAALGSVAAYDEPVDSISCTSWPADYLLFDSGGALVTPTYHYSDPRTTDGVKRVLSHISRSDLFEETGMQPRPLNTLFQLGAEKGRRLGRARHLMPVADGFNYLLSGVARVELSAASATQLFNPTTRAWSERVAAALQLPRGLLPPLVPAGTILGPLRDQVARDTGLEETQVISSCSHETASALVGLPVAPGEQWGYLSVGTWALVGTELAEPLINEQTREFHFNNEVGYGGSTRFCKHTMGLWLLEECQRAWEAKENGLGDDLLTHLAGSAEPFESLINPADPRFLEPGNMPAKIQDYCRETRQAVPRRPGAIFRCVLESLALWYRRILDEIASLSGRPISRVYILGGGANKLLTHFMANALQLPVVLAPPDATSIGNVLVQAVALGHIKSLTQGREMARNSFKVQTLVPHATAWNAAYDHLTRLLTNA